MGLRAGDVHIRVVLCDGVCLCRDGQPRDSLQCDNRVAVLWGDLPVAAEVSETRDSAGALGVGSTRAYLHRFRRIIIVAFAPVRDGRSPTHQQLSEHATETLALTFLLIMGPAF